MSKPGPTSDRPDSEVAESGQETREQSVDPTSIDEHSTDSAAASPSDAGVTPLDGDEFLQANRSNRDKYRAEAQEKAAKAARKKRGRETGETDTEPDAESRTEEVDSDRTPRKLAGGPSGPPRSPWRGRIPAIGTLSWPVLALVALAIVLAASTAALAVAYVDADRRADTAASSSGTGSILDTARDYAAEISTYNSADYSDLDRRIRDISTPAFTQTYIESSQDARRGSTAAESVSSAKAEHAGIMSLADGKAVVLVTLDQTLKSPQTAQQFPDGFPYQSRVKVTLVQQNGRWLMDDFAVL
ncbi:hypothetical protein [Gordonia terrae]|uniref:hypothetical protein n=1 Tax=Gordonia terrae TaxID=2055 RepID=UPI003F6AA21C